MKSNGYYCLYLAIDDLDYPRNRRIRQELANQNIEIIVVPRPAGRSYIMNSARMLGKVVTVLRIHGRPSFIILAEFAVHYAPMAWVISRLTRAPLIVDAFVRLVETNIEDFNRFSRRSVRGLAHRCIDWFSVCSADLVLTDTKVRAAAIAGHARGVCALPVGAPDWASERPRPSGGGEDFLSVLYYGNYIPLHGLDVVAQAIPRTRCARFIFVGSGERQVQFRTRYPDLGISFRESVPEDELAEIIWNSDVVLGIFGDSEKAQTVIANKVWQGLACGRPVVTRTSPALNELPESVSGQVIAIDPTPEALADAINSLWRGRAEARFDHFNSARDLRAYVDSEYDDFVRRVRVILQGVQGT